jgi:hypothetical protein
MHARMHACESVSERVESGAHARFALAVPRRFRAPLSLCGVVVTFTVSDEVHLLCVFMFTTR